MTIPDTKRVELTPTTAVERYALLARAATDIGYRVLQTVETLPGQQPAMFTAEEVETKLALLTTRERQMLELAAQGKTYAEIARSQWVTMSTVKFHLNNAYRNIGARNRTEASLLFPPQVKVSEQTIKDWDSLVDREKEVLMLVARGLKDREIATALYLSESTVKSHLGHAYQKLSVSNRIQVAAIVRALSEQITPFGRAKAEAKTAAKSLFTAGSLALYELEAKASSVPTQLS